jgi:hypothetical protein
MDKINIEWLKRQAKKLKKEKNITHTEALDQLAKDNKYVNWKHLQQANKNSDV